MAGRKKRRKRRAVVFFDANISGWISEHLSEVRKCAHWVTFWDPRGNARKGSADWKSFSKAKRRRLRRFFDFIGDENIFSENGISPSRMKDHDLASYMVRMRHERYPDRDLYIFYTHDKRFLRQESMRDHPALSVFENGEIVFVLLEVPPRGDIRKIADQVMRDFEDRYATMC